MMRNFVETVGYYALVPVGAAMALGYKVIVLVAGRLNNTRDR